MALKTIKLGGFVDENISGINDNFSDIELNKAAKTELPLRVSQLENDRAYQTEEQVRGSLAALINAAPETLDTLKELGDALGNDPNFAVGMTELVGTKVDKVAGKQLSESDFTAAEKVKLSGLSNYSLPIGGGGLGGVKNGGNVTIGSDGTMNAQGGAAATTLAFTEVDSKWGAFVGNKYTMAIPHGGKKPMGVYRKSGAVYKLSMADVAINGANIELASYDKFEGYVVVL